LPPCYSKYWSKKPFLWFWAKELKYLASSEAIFWMLLGSRNGAGEPTDFIMSSAVCLVPWFMRLRLAVEFEPSF